MMNDIEKEIELSVVMPCLNEEKTLPVCIEKAWSAIKSEGISGEIIIADNGSTDNSKEIAKALGARVVEVNDKGYGAALMGGIESARGRYIVMGDADDSYDFSKVGVFLNELRKGYDLVMGNRFRGGIEEGAMPFLHKYLGNPVLSTIGRVFFKSPIRDFHCGLRGFDKAAILALDLQTTGMEFASEMVVKATLHKLNITEVPTTLACDGRDRAPHLNAWNDGWRHLRFLLIYSPRWLFLYPGFFAMALGLTLVLWLLPGPKVVGALTLDIHTMLFSSVLIILGQSAVSFALFSKVFAIGAKLIPNDDRVTKILQIVSLERGLAAGIGLVALGGAGAIYAVALWESASFGPLNPSEVMRIAIPSLTSVAVGVQLMLASFFLSVLMLGHK